MSMVDREVVDGIRTALSRGGDPDRAAQQQRYMKSALPFRGLTSAQVKAALRPVLTAYTPVDQDRWEMTVRVLWDDAAYREERYAALALVRHSRAQPWLGVGTVPLLRHLVVTGAWWDLVDEISGHPLRDALLADRVAVDPVMRAWAHEDDVWLRRASVLCQLGAKESTDVTLLGYVVEANLDDRSFWLRKAIGWALRDYAKTDPEWVLREVEVLGERLSGLSRREALRHLGPEVRAGRESAEGAG